MSFVNGSVVRSYCAYWEAEARNSRGVAWRFSSFYRNGTLQDSVGQAHRASNVRHAGSIERRWEPLHEILNQLSTGPRNPLEVLGFPLLNNNNNCHFYSCILVTARLYLKHELQADLNLPLTAWEPAAIPNCA
jgi:hypothetical protein